jgi:acyl-coenzyme A synthetase/AMP-(fatty) acid ligase
VRTNLSFAGYHGQPELTAETLVDGWVRTRDIGHLDDEGYLYLVDRLQDRILTRQRSWPIYSRPIEDVLAGHPEVRAAAVIGVPDPVAGEVVKAYVTLRPTYDPSPDLLLDILGFARKRLGPAVAPREIAFDQNLPHTTSGKIMRRLLKARELGLPEGDLSTLEAVS